MEQKDEKSVEEVVDMDADSKSAEVLDGAEVEEETDLEPEDEDEDEDGAKDPARDWPYVRPGTGAVS